MTSTLERDLAMLASIDPVVDGATPYEPLHVAAIGNPPRANVDPDVEKRWIRRMLPLLGARKGRFALAMTASVIGLLSQVAVPRVVMATIDQGLAKRTQPVSHFVMFLVVIGAIRAVFTFIHRSLLYRVAYDLEYDLRAIIYEHLSRLSFSFYDRVQSGQLISRANSDIRSVQMFLAFAPLIGLQCVSFVVAFGAHAARSTCGWRSSPCRRLPFVFLIGLSHAAAACSRCRGSCRRALADVATIVDENVTGVRVVKSFAAEQQPDRACWPAPPGGCGGARTASIDIRARYAPSWRTCPASAWPSCCSTAAASPSTARSPSARSSPFNAYVLMLQAPFRMLGC